MLLNITYSMMIEQYGSDAVDRLLNPPTPAERKLARLDELRAAGLLDHPSVEVA